MPGRSKTPKQQKLIERIENAASDVYHKAKKVLHDDFIEPAEKLADIILPGKPGRRFHNTIFTETQSTMSSRSKKSASRKNTRRARRNTQKKNRKAAKSIKLPPKGKMPGPKARAIVNAAAAKARGSRAYSAIGMTRAPPMKLLKMRMAAGLTMRGGVIEGVTEIVPDVQLSSANNVAGTVLYQTVITPQVLAPGSRFADLASQYDQYCFESLQLNLGSDIPFTLNGVIGGGLERDPLDPLPAAGGLLDVPKYMEHQHFHAVSIANRRGIRFPKDARAVRKSGKGPTSGMFFNRVPTSTQNISDCYQGQLVIFVHTALANDTAGGVQFPISLGPLVLRWRVRLKEAAERNQQVGNGDKHNGTSGGVLNPLNWGSSSKIQSTTIAPWSTLQLATSFSGGSYYVNFPVGMYFVSITNYFATTGATDFYWSNAGSATGYTVTSAAANAASTKLSASNVTQTMWVQVQVTTNGNYAVFTSAGTSTGWTLNSNQTTFFIFAIPSSATSLLKHPSHVVRSLAFCKQRDGADRKEELKKEVADALRDLGVERKYVEPETKYDRLIELAHKEHFDPEKPKRELTFEEKLARAHNLYKLEQDADWEISSQPDDIEDCADEYEQKVIQSARKYRSFRQPLQLRIEPDSPRDRVAEEKKAPSAQPSRPSSLKSSGGKDKN